ncbi:MAG: ribosomal protein methyltransferase [Acidobacteriota bacterium]|nr:ribosomal protein methyltransferase [Acidobacteriota bacterium]
MILPLKLPPAMPHLRLTYLLPPDLEDALVADLFEAGTLGVQSTPAADGRLHLTAWFPEGASPEIDLEGWRTRGVEALGGEVQPDTDWLALWREKAQPFAVARGFFVDPREPGEPPVDPADVPAGRRLLHLPARGAFGTGSHESTSLVLDLLEEVDLAGKRVLDVGTGTGVLCFAALLLGARSAVGFDNDLTAPFHGLENRRLNRPLDAGGAEPAFFAGTTAALRLSPRFDLALVNVVPEQILPELPQIVRCLQPGAEAILSGILVERGRQVLERARGLGLAEVARREAGDWVAFRLALSPSP